jgi:hypothetical protein
MSTALDDGDFNVDPEAPEGYRSATAKGPYIAVISVASVAFLIGQFVLPQLAMFAMMPGFAGGGMMFEIAEPQVDRAAVWQGQIWLPVKKLGSAPNPQVVLKAATFTGEWVKESDLPLGFSPEFLLADGERLWCVGTGNVSIVEGRNVTTSYPARSLNHPSNPYLHDGRLRIVDRDATGLWHILEFDEGEWTAVGRVALPDAPPLPTNAPAIAARLRQGGELFRVQTTTDGVRATYTDGVRT